MKKKGFTLLELLIVLILLSIVFTVVLSVIKSVGQGSIFLKKQAETLKKKAYIYYTLKHQLEDIKRMLVFKKDEEGDVYLGFITTLGEVYPAVVKVRYRFDKGKLFYCESLYTYDNFLSCENNTETLLGYFKRFKVRIFYRGKWYSEGKSFSGIPEKVEVILGNTPIIAEIRTDRVFK